MKVVFVVSDKDLGYFIGNSHDPNRRKVNIPVSDEQHEAMRRAKNPSIQLDEVLEVLREQLREERDARLELEKQSLKDRKRAIRAEALAIISCITAIIALFM